MPPGDAPGASRSGPGDTEAVSADELTRVVEEASEDVRYATSTLSAAVRNIGIGLSLLLYSLAFGEDKANVLRDYKPWVICASILGVTTLSADALQYLFLWRRKTRLLQGLREAQQRGVSLTVPVIETLDENRFKTMASAMFWLKALAALAGCGVVVVALGLRLALPPSPLPSEARPTPPAAPATPASPSGSRSAP